MIVVPSFQATDLANLVGLSFTMDAYNELVIEAQESSSSKIGFDLTASEAVAFGEALAVAGRAILAREAQ